MNNLTLDGESVTFEDGDTIMSAAARAGIHIPHLCWHPSLGQSGACRICVVKANGQLAAACTTKASAGMKVENRSATLDDKRRLLLQMLFVEGNHFCPSCEKSGDCLLQETAYEMGMKGPHFEEFYPDRPLDASHPDMLIDFDRCILCKLCVRASSEIDKKNVFAIGNRGMDTHLLINSISGKLADSEFANDDFAASVCPVGAILPKRRGFVIPITERRFDKNTLQSEAQAKASPSTRQQMASTLDSRSLDGQSSETIDAGDENDNQPI